MTPEEIAALLNQVTSLDSAKAIICKVVGGNADLSDAIDQQAAIQTAAQWWASVANDIVNPAISSGASIEQIKALIAQAS